MKEKRQYAIFAGFVKYVVVMHVFNNLVSK